MLWIVTDYHDTTLALDYFTLFTNALYGRSDLHCKRLLAVKFVVSCETAKSYGMRARGSQRKRVFRAALAAQPLFVRRRD